MGIVSAPEREFDVVVWGATGFAVRLTAQFLLERYDTSLRWALGGRNRAKLEAVREAISVETGVDASGLPLVSGDCRPVSLGDPGKLNLGLIWGAVTPNASPARGTPRTRVSRTLSSAPPGRQR